MEAREVGKTIILLVEIFRENAKEFPSHLMRVSDEMTSIVFGSKTSIDEELLSQQGRSWQNLELSVLL